jgi:hypothetical protein
MLALLQMLATDILQNLNSCSVNALQKFDGLLLIVCWSSIGTPCNHLTPEATLGQFPQPRGNAEGCLWGLEKKTFQCKTKKLLLSICCP